VLLLAVFGYIIIGGLFYLAIDIIAGNFINDEGMTRSLGAYYILVMVWPFIPFVAVIHLYYCAARGMARRLRVFIYERGNDDKREESL
jgi:Na+-driven multidrug efflux pump